MAGKKVVILLPILLNGGNGGTIDGDNDDNCVVPSVRCGCFVKCEMRTEF
jgi:hypothetical protein